MHAFPLWKYWQKSAKYISTKTIIAALFLLEERERESKYPIIANSLQNYHSHKGQLQSC